MSTSITSRTRYNVHKVKIFQQRPYVLYNPDQNHNAGNMAVMDGNSQLSAIFWDIKERSLESQVRACVRSVEQSSRGQQHGMGIWPMKNVNRGTNDSKKTSEMAQGYRIGRDRRMQTRMKGQHGWIWLPYFIFGTSYNQSPMNLPRFNNTDNRYQEIKRDSWQEKSWSNRGPAFALDQVESEHCIVHKRGRWLLKINWTGAFTGIKGSTMLRFSLSQWSGIWTLEAAI